jgi:hypothetical protein
MFLQPFTYTFFPFTPSSLKLNLPLRFVYEILCVHFSFPACLPSHSNPLNLTTLQIYAKIGNHSDFHCGIFFLSYPPFFSEFRTKREKKRDKQTNKHRLLSIPYKTSRPSYNSVFFKFIVRTQNDSELNGR